MTPDQRICEIKFKLTRFVLYEEGENLRQELERLSKPRYCPQLTCDEVVDFIKDNADGLSIERVSAQDQLHPNVWEIFTVSSQHVYGDCLREVIDKAARKSHWK